MACCRQCSDRNRNDAASRCQTRSECDGPDTHRLPLPSGGMKTTYLSNSAYSLLLSAPLEDIGQMPSVSGVFLQNAKRRRAHESCVRSSLSTCSVRCLRSTQTDLYIEPHFVFMMLHISDVQRNRPICVEIRQRTTQTDTDSFKHSTLITD